MARRWKMVVIGTSVQLEHDDQAAGARLSGCECSLGHEVPGAHFIVENSEVQLRSLDLDPNPFQGALIDFHVLPLERVTHRNSCGDRPRPRRWWQSHYCHRGAAPAAPVWQSRRPPPARGAVKYQCLPQKSAPDRFDEVRDPGRSHLE